MSRHIPDNLFSGRWTLVLLSAACSLFLEKEVLPQNVLQTVMIVLSGATIFGILGFALYKEHEVAKPLEDWLKENDPKYRFGY